MSVHVAASTLLLCLLLVACGSGSDPGTGGQPQVEAAAEELLGHDMLIQASVAHTGSLPEAIAARYGVRRERHGFMLVVRLTAPDGSELASPPSRITASARDLRGVEQAVSLERAAPPSAAEYVGTFQIQPPDTLTLQVDVVSAEGRTSTLRFSREIMPAQR
ncbi:DUF4426 domain-containing protein [Luteimonas sp. A277]